MVVGEVEIRAPSHDTFGLSRLEFLVIVGAMGAALCTAVFGYYRLALGTFAAGAALFIFLTLLFLRWPRVLVYAFMVFLLISAVFVHFVPETVGFLTKEVLLAFIWALVILKAGVEGRFAIRNLRIGTVEVLLLALIAFLFIQSLRQTPLRVGFFGFRSVALYAPIYFLIPTFFDTKERIQKLLQVLWVSAGFVAVVAILQFFFTRTVMESLGFIPEEVAWRGTMGALKASSTLGSASATGTFLAMVLLLFLTTQREEKVWRQGWWFPGLYVLLVLVGLLLTLSRISLLAFVVGVVLLSFYFGRKALRYYPVAIAAIIILNVTLGNVILQNLLSTFGAGESAQGWRSVRFRATIIERTFSELIPQHPILGFGLGVTGAPSERNRDVAPFGYLVMDNYYLKLWVETGLVGLSLFVVFLAVVIGRGLRYFKSLSDGFLRSLCLGIALGVIALAVVNVASTALELPVINCYFWILIGLLRAARAVDRKARV